MFFSGVIYNFFFQWCYNFTQLIRGKRFEKGPLYYSSPKNGLTMRISISTSILGNFETFDDFQVQLPILWPQRRGRPFEVPGAVASSSGLPSGRRARYRRSASSTVVAAEHLLEEPTKGFQTCEQCSKRAFINGWFGGI